jgi:hypothetical protein
MWASRLQQTFGLGGAAPAAAAGGPIRGAPFERTKPVWIRAEAPRAPSPEMPMGLAFPCCTMTGCPKEAGGRSTEEIISGARRAGWRVAGLAASLIGISSAWADAIQISDLLKQGCEIKAAYFNQMFSELAVRSFREILEQLSSASSASSTSADCDFPSTRESASSAMARSSAIGSR